MFEFDGVEELKSLATKEEGFGVAAGPAMGGGTAVRLGGGVAAMAACDRRSVGGARGGGGEEGVEPWCCDRPTVGWTHGGRRHR